jgi:GTPase SAR1 family protein
MVYFGQVVIGAPGAGKTTYCQGMKLFLEEIGRPCDIINLDFANDALPYECAVDVRELISIEAVMGNLSLGPNGGLVYCMENLLENIDWLVDRLRALDKRYLLFDFPGQVELYSHHSVAQDLTKKLVKALDIRLCSVHLVDSFHCSSRAFRKR